MPFFQKFRLLRSPAAATASRRRRKTVHTSAAADYLEQSQPVAFLIFVVTVAAIVLISFVGVTSATLPVLPNQLAMVRIVAGAPFTYESKLKTELDRKQLLNRVPPVYQLEFGPLQQFDANLRELLAALEQLDRDFPAAGTASAMQGAFSPSARRAAALTAIVESFNAKGPYHVSADDVALLLGLGDAKARFALVENGLAALREIYREGVYDNGPTFAAADSVSLFRVRRPSGEIAQVRVQSLEEALTFLRINLAAEGVSRDTTLALFRLFSNGVTPNLIYDRVATERLQQQVLADVRPVIVSVERGQTIIEPGTRVTPEQYEMLVAHRDFLLHNGDVAFSEGLQFFGRILLVLAMVMASMFYIRLEDPETMRSNGRLALLALVVILNLALVRTTYWIGQWPYFLENTAAASLLPYVAPTALAPLLVAILIDAGSAIFMALLISIFTGVIYGNRLDLLVITFLASMVGIFACRAIRQRSRVVRAAGLGGLTVACFALLIGIADQLPVLIVGRQMVAGLATGLLTGVVVAGLLPVLEGFFKRTTDITLLELTDFNHPLLHLMQMEAPGTYHHSLVVASLAENAANAIGANALLCRVCSLFHDVGKTAQPGFFAENQHEGANPHDEHNPSFSALIIKSHVKEGVDVALKHKLPRAVIDVIRQHHGTTLIQSFYQRARGGESRAPAGGSAAPFAVAARPPAASLEARVCETTYRYDGPKPQFKESGIVMLADGVEAATRSLRRVTPQHLGELIDQIFKSRLEDGQLDEAPLTLAELGQIKSSFNFTLLNMLHARVAYPPDVAGKPEVRNGAKKPEQGAG
ncbi:MAG TPA: HDIG domain-containing protein [Opitutaceae bacterium]|nr:HDIG domain-containing protein [Opitutaceae bacterium]